MSSSRAHKNSGQTPYFMSSYHGKASLSGVRLRRRTAIFRACSSRCQSFDSTPYETVTSVAKPCFRCTSELAFYQRSPDECLLGPSSSSIALESVEKCEVVHNLGKSLSSDSGTGERHCLVLFAGTDHPPGTHFARFSGVPWKPKVEGLRWVGPPAGS